MSRAQYDIESAIDDVLENDELYGQQQTLIETIRYCEGILEKVESDIEKKEAEQEG